MNVQIEYVQGPAVAMVHTKVRLFYPFARSMVILIGACSMANWEIQLGALDPHHRELHVNYIIAQITSHTRHLWANLRFEAERRKNTECSQ